MIFIYFHQFIIKSGITFNRYLIDITIQNGNTKLYKYIVLILKKSRFLFSFIKSDPGSIWAVIDSRKVEH